MKRHVFLLLGKTEFNKYSKKSMKKVYNKIKEEYFISGDHEGMIKLWKYKKYI